MIKAFISRKEFVDEAIIYRLSLLEIYITLCMYICIYIY